MTIDEYEYLESLSAGGHCDYCGEDGSCNCDGNCIHQTGRWRDMCSQWKEEEDE